MHVQKIYWVFIFFFFYFPSSEQWSSNCWSNTCKTRNLSRGAKNECSPIYIYCFHWRKGAGNNNVSHCMERKWSSLSWTLRKYSIYYVAKIQISACSKFKLFEQFTCNYSTLTHNSGKVIFINCHYSGALHCTRLV